MNIKTFIVLFALTLSACSEQATHPQTAAVSPAETVTHADYAPLEVISVFQGGDGESLELINLDHSMRFHTVLSIANVGDKYVRLAVGDRVKIAGDYRESYPVNIGNITHIEKVANPDKAKCEAQLGKKWQPQGKAQIPTCVSKYRDGGKACTASSDCEGNCLVKGANQSGQCAYSDSRFGCRAVIEAFRKNGQILCID